PDIVPLIKRVVYMGGAFYQQGNVTTVAEFNWYFDPEAARIRKTRPQPCALMTTMWTLISKWLHCRKISFTTTPWPPSWAVS
ncbi:MAG: nucleoside hydrolase, partial [Selenomonas sp.]|nr:nucleoside hydrolase [Selenomonas sp.]